MLLLLACCLATLRALLCFKPSHISILGEGGSVDWCWWDKLFLAALDCQVSMSHVRWSDYFPQKYWNGRSFVITRHLRDWCDYPKQGFHNANHWYRIMWRQNILSRKRKNFILCCCLAWLVVPLLCWSAPSLSHDPDQVSHPNVG